VIYACCGSLEIPFCEAETHSHELLVQRISAAEEMRNAAEEMRKAMETARMFPIEV
jgi:hypothetical protein